MSASAKSLNKQLLKALKEISKEQFAVKAAMEVLLTMLCNMPAVIHEDIVPRRVAEATAQMQAPIEEQILSILIKRTRSRDARIEAEQANQCEGMHILICGRKKNPTI